VMRIAPVGLVYRNAPKNELYKAVTAALLCTHVHPEAIDGAYLQAWTVAKLCKITDVTTLDSVELVKELISLSKTEIVKNKLIKVLDLCAKGEDDETIVRALTEPNMFGEQFQIRASEAFACAIAFLVKYGIKDPETCLIKIDSAVGDADTVGAITGALLGALHGTGWIPQRWFSRIEDGQYGRKFMLEIATKVAQLYRLECDPEIFDLSHFAIQFELQKLKAELITTASRITSVSYFNELFERFKDPNLLTMHTQVALELWRLVLEGKCHFLANWINFLTQKKVLVIDRDQWNQFMILARDYEDLQRFVNRPPSSVNELIDSFIAKHLNKI